jgi:hypothetical protein
MAKILVKLAALLILSGMMLHEAVPHHHHSMAGEVQTCCHSHEHKDAESNDVQPCTILSNIKFDNYKPQIQVYSQELKRSHSDFHFDTCEHCAEQYGVFALLKTPINIPQSVFIEKEYPQSV